VIFFSDACLRSLETNTFVHCLSAVGWPSIVALTGPISATVSMTPLASQLKLWNRAMVPLMEKSMPSQS
jgi:hypothetical protein